MNFIKGFLENKKHMAYALIGFAVVTLTLALVGMLTHANVLFMHIPSSTPTSVATFPTTFAMYGGIIASLFGGLALIHGLALLFCKKDLHATNAIKYVTYALLGLVAASLILAIVVMVEGFNSNVVKSADVVRLAMDGKDFGMGPIPWATLVANGTFK